MTDKQPETKEERQFKNPMLERFLEFMIESINQEQAESLRYKHNEGLTLTLKNGDKLFIGPDNKE